MSQSSVTATALGFSFEVWGKVQGVAFRKYTQRKATELGVAGWIRNHKERGTVQGEVVCHANNMAACEEMKQWLKTVGSPASKIDKADFGSLSVTTKLSDWYPENNSHAAVFEIHKSVAGKTKN